MAAIVISSLIVIDALFLGYALEDARLGMPRDLILALLIIAANILGSGFLLNGNGKKES